MIITFTEQTGILSTQIISDIAMLYENSIHKLDTSE